MRGGEGQLLYEIWRLDEDSNLSDGGVGHSRQSHIDLDLLRFGKFVFGSDDEHVFFPWELYTTANNLIASVQRSWRDYPMPEHIGDVGALNMIAVLKYRPFSLFVLQSLADEGYLDLFKHGPRAHY